MNHPHLRAAREAIDRAAGALSADVIGRPVEGRWSIAEILEHLTLAFRANDAALRQTLESGESRARAPTLRQHLARLLVVEAGYFPIVEAPRMTRPTRSIPAERAVAEIREALDVLDATLTSVERKYGADVAVSNHPYFSGLSVPHWRTFHWRHTLHHMAQVRARTIRQA